MNGQHKGSRFLRFLRDNLCESGFSDDSEFVGSSADQVMSVPGTEFKGEHIFVGIDDFGLTFHRGTGRCG